MSNLIRKLPFFDIFNKHLIIYPAPSNLNYLWSFGSLALVAYAIQVISGIFLTMHYTANTSEAFNAIDHIMRDVNNGWFIRYIHANFASGFFIMLYLHIAKAFYYQSYITKKGAWLSGIIIFLLVILTSFLGYVLPWGQMSYWAATVIVSLTTTLPYGEFIKAWILGGFAIDNPTLQRFYTFHFIFPIIILFLIILHFGLLHLVSSSNPIGIENKKDMIKFFPFYWVKDFFGIVIFFLFLSPLIFFAPEYLMHPDNNIPANPMQTPEHIVPEWYFLIFYGILRSVPNKTFGVILLVSSIIVLFLLPLIAEINIKGVRFNFFFKQLTIFFFINSILLSIIGGKPIIEPFYTIGQLCTIIYFFYFGLLLVSWFIKNKKTKYYL